MSLPISIPNLTSILKHEDVDALISLSLREDEIKNDLTTLSCQLEPVSIRASIIAKKPTIACGFPILTRILEISGWNTKFKISKLADEGTFLKPDSPWIFLEGPKSEMLALERTILNFLMRTCGIAKYTNDVVKKLEGSNTKLLHTRKTAPGHRRSDLYSCFIGGAQAHRRSLGDYLLFKENHISSLGDYQALADAVARSRISQSKFVEIEVRDFTELKYALACKPDRIMLDNFKIKDIQTAVQLFGSQVELEASGGITLENAEEYAKTGVDYISLGAITHSAPSADLSMLFDETH